ncbi:MAG TPA: hypothetical protein PLV52_07505, partial [Candidatus Omnitrophota bacterium]|nr:hypothetical protein [Candidatus Omnitrophota bacterium]
SGVASYMSMSASAVYNYAAGSNSVQYGTVENLRSRTHYTGFKGDELADYSHNFLSSGTVKDTTVYQYASNDILTRTTTYQGGTADVKPSTGTKKYQTDYIGYVRGEEVQDITTSYGGDAANGSTAITVYFYGASHIRASAAVMASTLAMTASSIYDTTAGLSHTNDQYLDSAKTDLRSRTHYFGYKGEELTSYSQSFMKDQSGAFGTVRDTTVYNYKTATKDVLDYTTTYKGGTENVKPSSGTMKNRTYYYGTVRGEELTNYSWNYSGDASSAISTTTVYFYGSDISIHNRATSSVIGATQMTASATYNNDASGALTLYATPTDLRSRTHYIGFKGDELADYSQNFLKSSGLVMDTTVYTYNRDVLSFTYTYQGGEINERPSDGTK